MTVYQTYKYYTVYPHDRIGLKIFIRVVCSFKPKRPPFAAAYANEGF